MSEETIKYYAVFANNRVRDKRNNPTIFRYYCPGAKLVKISEHVKTFIYYCSATNSFDIHEVSTGVRIAGSDTVTEALKETAKFFKQANESFFLDQVRAIGVSFAHPEMSFSSAMEYLIMPVQS